MTGKCMILRKGSHWYVVNSQDGDERAILLTILEYAEHDSYNIEQEDLLPLIDRLGWTLEIHDNLGAA